MKKSYLFVAALALVLASCGNEEVVKFVENPAGFENITLQPEKVYHLDATGTFESGDFIFDQDVSYGYYFGNIVSNKTGVTFDPEANPVDNDMNLSGRAHSGKNFVVWTVAYADPKNGGVAKDHIRLKSAAVVPGFYVNNTPWVEYAIKNGDNASMDGDEFSLPFGENDFFTLTITGSRNGKQVNGKATIDLARGTEYIKDWTYVSLAHLGMIDELQFTLTGSKHNQYGLTTPAYFAFDDLGAEGPKVE